MARKNPFADIMDKNRPQSNDAVLDYTIKGASRSLMTSIDEMAARADSLLSGEAIVELDPKVIDPSFVVDRIDADEGDFAELLQAIGERGQDSPILVRPHPKVVGRYMVVYGHRRLKAAQELGRNVKAVVKDIQDRDHVVAQGQENSARANLSFIERARFAASLAGFRYDDDNATVRTALSVDRTTLSKMLSVANLPAPILNAIGPAKHIGRDRWYELKLLLDNPSLLDAALRFVNQSEHADSSDARFNAVFDHLKATKSAKRTKGGPTKRNWAPADGALSAEIVTDGRRFNLAIKGKGSDAMAFGDYLSGNLNNFYEAFRQTIGTTKDGD